MKQLSYLESLSAKTNGFNFKLHKKYDVSNVLNNVNKINDEWNIYDFRQNRKYSERRNPHLYTNTFVIQYHSFDWNFGDKIISEVKDPAMLDVVSKIVNGQKLNYHIDTLLKICVALNLTPNDIIEKDIFIQNQLK